MNATDVAGYAGLALIGHHLGGPLGAGVALTVGSILTAVVVNIGRE